MLSAAHGVRSVHAYSTSSVSWGQSVGGDQAFDWGAFTPLVVGDCPTLKELLIVTDCVDGDVFAAPAATRSVVGVDQLTDPDAVTRVVGGPLIPGPGVTVTVAAPGDPRWTVPATMRVAAIRSGALLGTADSLLGSLFVTPGALAGDLRPASTVTGIVRIDLADPDAADNVANAIAGVAPLRSPSGALLGDDPVYAPVRTAMDLVIVALFGAVGVGLVITVVEESRERRRALAVLSAVGARRRTVAGWVLWQTAIPMILGVPLALGAGLGLGAALLRVAGVAPTVPWTNIVVVCATAFAVVLVTTAASLPALGRLMRPDGLRIG
ncbi:hypothetical protein MXD62_30805 [Frankia sp. Mgl5]|uniref:FtsX-like permease family protein n=1 Tax=Frankia sp. Mgl5 TaxID=2933793 RepID=UPI002010B260|nr:FtsX-like permease family protein [Frankia sp. Mgl5]MCK9931475.1 hypothetical protein [Frankia sp. Mgl5]